MTEEQKVAELIHRHNCHRDHTDQCDWFYCSWKEPRIIREAYLGKAKKLLIKYSYEEIIKAFEIYKEAEKLR